MKCQVIFQREMLIYIASPFITIPTYYVVVTSPKTSVLFPSFSMALPLNIVKVRTRHKPHTVFIVHIRLLSQSSVCIGMILIKTRIYTIWST